MNNFDASTIINYSPRKSRLVIDAIRGKYLDESLDILAYSNKPKAKKIYLLLLNAINNLQISNSDYNKYTVFNIIAEQAQKYVRVMPRAKGSASKIRRRYSRVKVKLNKIDN